MNASNKVYSAPKLESLSLRETRDIDVNAGASGGGVTVTAGVGISGLGS